MKNINDYFDEQDSKEERKRIAYDVGYGYGRGEAEEDPIPNASMSEAKARADWFMKEQDLINIKGYKIPFRRGFINGFYDYDGGNA